MLVRLARYRTTREVYVLTDDYRIAGPLQAWEWSHDGGHAPLAEWPQHARTHYEFRLYAGELDHALDEIARARIDWI